MTRPPFSISDREVAAGRLERFEIPVARLTSGSELGLPVQVLHGSEDGPTVWLSGAVHGDELCGVEIIRQVLEAMDPTTMRGTLIACPIVNVHGFNTGDRYFPDRRDLNRSFPGSARGSLASRVAHLFMTEVVDRCDVGIDFHSGTDHRSNLPHIRGDMEDDRTRSLAEVFGAPIALHSRLRDGSLRYAATERDTTVLLFEGGEAHRIEPATVSAGRDGTLRVLSVLGMRDDPPSEQTTRVAMSSTWIRAPRSGILHLMCELGDEVDAGDRIGTVVDAFGTSLGHLRARSGGIVVGQRQHPLVNQGDAVSHIAHL
jgi:predicted deacylase